VTWTDDLTALPSRRALLTAHHQAFDAGEPTGLVLADLNGFKYINDTHGHPTGDHVLQVIATRMTTIWGPDVLVARLGGDEFAVLTPDHDPARLARRAEATLDALTAPIPAPTGPHRHHRGRRPGPRRRRDVPDQSNPTTRPRHPHQQKPNPRKAPTMTTHPRPGCSYYPHLMH
jgi:GGDEF domain-containing protein